MSLSNRRPDLVVLYYLVTPAFVVADLGFGLPVRVAGLSSPEHRMVYYAAVFGLGMLCRAKPILTPFVGMAEGVVNLVLLFLSVLLPIWSLADTGVVGEATNVGLSGVGLANVVLAGSALIVAFHRSRAGVGRVLRGGGRGAR